MPLVGWDGHLLTPFGTCFAITSTGVALTAAHVVEDFVSKHGTATHKGDAGLYAIYETDEKISESEDHFGGLLPVVSVAANPGGDLCALKFALPRRGDTHLALTPISIDIGLPQIGQRCVAIGYPIMSLTGEVLRQEHSPAEATPVEYERRLATSTGRIEAIHHARRDNYSLTFPCFLTDARYDRGMSGGPVIGDNGRVFGMVCRGMDVASNDPDISETSYASLLGPILQLGVSQSSGVKNIMSLWQEGAISLSGFDDLDVQETDPVIGYQDPESS
jgi:S1-C subfamily serine protease